MPEAEIHFVLINGDRPVLTIPEGEDVDEAFRKILDETGRWIDVGNQKYVRRESVVSLTLVREPGLFVA
jgi:hypothetical protein